MHHEDRAGVNALIRGINEFSSQRLPGRPFRVRSRRRVLWKIRGLAKRSDRKISNRVPTGVGDVNAHRLFIESHKPFLEEFPALQSLLEEASSVAEARCYPESPAQPTDAESSNEELARRVAFYLEEAAREEFGELLILAGNGMGIGAKKPL